MHYKDFIIRKIGNQFFAYYQGKAKGFTALAKGGNLSVLGDYFRSLAAIQSSIRAFHAKNTKKEFIAPAVYRNGVLLLAYRTGHGGGKEIEFLDGWHALKTTRVREFRQSICGQIEFSQHCHTACHAQPRYIIAIQAHRSNVV